MHMRAQQNILLFDNGELIDTICSQLANHKLNRIRFFKRCVSFLIYSLCIWQNENLNRKERDWVGPHILIFKRIKERASIWQKKIYENTVTFCYTIKHMAVAVAVYLISIFFISHFLNNKMTQKNWLIFVLLHAVRIKYEK